MNTPLELAERESIVLEKARQNLLLKQTQSGFVAR